MNAVIAFVNSEIIQFEGDHNSNISCISMATQQFHSFVRYECIGGSGLRFNICLFDGIPVHNCMRRLGVFNIELEQQNQIDANSAM